MIENEPNIEDIVKLPKITEAPLRVKAYAQLIQLLNK